MMTSTYLTQADFQPEAEDLFYDWLAALNEAEAAFENSDDYEEIEYANELERDAWNKLVVYKKAD